MAIVGAALWIAGASVTTQPTSYVAQSTFHDPTTYWTAVNESRSIRFTVALVLDQPWIGEGFFPYRFELSAAPGAGISDVRIFDAAVFLCGTSCSSSEFQYVDMPILNETSPNHWVAYDPHLIYSAQEGAPVYITYALPLMVSFANGSRYAGGWSSGVRLAPLAIQPDLVGPGWAIFTWGIVLCAVTATVALVSRFGERRAGM